MKWKLLFKKTEIRGLENAKLFFLNVMAKWSMVNHMKDTKYARFNHSSLEIHASQS